MCWVVPHLLVIIAFFLHLNLQALCARQCYEQAGDDGWCLPLSTRYYIPGYVSRRGFSARQVSSVRRARTHEGNGVALIGKAVDFAAVAAAQIVAY